MGEQWTPTTEDIKARYVGRHENNIGYFDRWLSDHDRAVVHEAAEAIRHHATAPTELVWPIVKIDRLIAWVADWIENPPEWVHVSYRDRGED